MSMLDSFFNKGFRASKGRTLLKLTIPRIKSLRNRREVHLKQMRRDIAKVLETGQEATARIWVEHIIREENMMAAQEILELFCELISVQLPIIEAQRECPLDLKEAISSICFAAPRCSDLPELLQVQMLFASKYGKEFVASATELMPDCCVNRQLVELLSVRAPSPGKKLKLLKEIAEEHELDWDPSATETEFTKEHKDLLNASTSTQASMITMLPLPEEKHDEILNSESNHFHDQQPKSDSGFDPLNFPQVPKVSSRSSQNVASASEVAPSIPAVHHGPSYLSATSDNSSQESHSEVENVLQEKRSGKRHATPTITLAAEEKSKKTQFVPFISPPSDSSYRFSPRPTNLPPATTSRTRSDSEIDLQDVLAAAEAAAETAECAAAPARSAATLAQTRISELSKRSGDRSANNSDENPFHNEVPYHQPITTEELKFNGQNFNSDHHNDSKPHFDHQASFGTLNGFPKF